MIGKIFSIFNKEVLKMVNNINNHGIMRLKNKNNKLTIVSLN